MYYFNASLIASEAVMPRILAEDTGAAELRNPLFCAKTEFKLRRPGWLRRRTHSPVRCPRVPNSCPASC